MDMPVPIKLTEIFNDFEYEKHGFLNLRSRRIDASYTEPLTISWDRVEEVRASEDGGSIVSYQISQLKPRPRVRTGESVSLNAPRDYEPGIKKVHVEETPEEIENIVTSKLREIYGPD